MLGIPHPTGYPLYVLLGKLWTLVVPVRLDRLADESLQRRLRRAGVRAALPPRPRGSACAGGGRVFAALLLAVRPSFWAEATIQRVYTLNALFVVLATIGARSLGARRDGASLAAAFLCCGLGATNHTFMAVYAVALALFVVVDRPADPARPRVALLAGGGVPRRPAAVPLPAAPRSRADPPLDWGDPETLRRLPGRGAAPRLLARAWIESPADLLPIAARLPATASAPSSAGRAPRWR